MSDDDFRVENSPIGTRGKAGRGNAKVSPSVAARSLAGRSAVPKKPVKKANA